MQYRRKKTSQKPRLLCISAFGVVAGALLCGFILLNTFVWKATTPTQENSSLPGSASADTSSNPTTIPFVRSSPAPSRRTSLPSVITNPLEATDHPGLRAPAEVTNGTIQATSIQPSHPPSPMPSSTDLPSQFVPTPQPTATPTSLSYRPGDLAVSQAGLLLSTGLTARIVARAGEPVSFHTNGESSAIPFHPLPDFGATFPDNRPDNPGGWIYVSNSEVREPWYEGGVGSMMFNKDGHVIDYQRVLDGTTANCGGGRTPWGSWISCEEYEDGRNYQVDPTGVREPRPITLGSGDDKGKFESFAYDERKSHFFVTEDHEFGPLRRFIPTAVNLTDPWETLHGPGETTYLRLLPESDHSGQYEWTDDKASASRNANLFYRNSEGIDVADNELFFVSKELKTLFVLNLDSGTYTSHTTRSGLFDGQPDQLQRILVDDDQEIDKELLYFTEDGGSDAGVHARDKDDNFFTIMESPVYQDETTGLAFSPDAMHMYVAYQVNGILFDVTRDDGLPFHAKSLNIKYHAASTSGI